MNIKNIISGWQNFIVKSEVTEKLAEQRAEHCIKCSELKHGEVLAMIKDDLKEIESHYCAKCMCPLSAKIRSKNETCPLSKW